MTITFLILHKFYTNANTLPAFHSFCISKPHFCKTIHTILILAQFSLIKSLMFTWTTSHTFDYSYGQRPVVFQLAIIASAIKRPKVSSPVFEMPTLQRGRA